MGKYEDLTRSFYEDYEQPVIEDYIVGFSGLDPDRKIKPEEIDHEKLDGLLGGDFSGRYHLTNDQVSKFTGYQGQIDKAIQDSSTAITKLRSDTDNAVTTLRNDTNQAIMQLRTDSEDAVMELRSEKNCEIQNLNMDIDTAKSQMGYQVSQISARQEVIEGSQANISARFDEAIEGVTEDSEVIDARVDAEDVRHVNLGGNIRSLHRRVNASDGISHERDEAIHEHLQEQADELAGEVLSHTLEIDANEKRLSAAEGGLESAHKLIRDETEKRERETEEGRKADDQLREEISNARKETVYRGEHLQEQAGELAGGILRLTLQREEDISSNEQDREDLQLGIMLARKLSTSRHDHLQEQSDDLAGALLDNTVETYSLGEKLKDETENRKNDTRYLTGEIASEACERLLSDQALNDDMYKEYATRKKADDELRSDISASREETHSLYEELREEADELSGEILRKTFEREADQAENARNLAHEEKQRISRDEHIQEQADELAAAILTEAHARKESYQREKVRGKRETAQRGQDSENFTHGLIENARSIYEEGQERRRLAARVSEIHSRTEEEISDTASGLLSLSQEVSRGHEKLKERIAHWEKKHTQAEQRLTEELSDLSAGLMQTGIMLREEAASRRHDFSVNSERTARIQEATIENASTILRLLLEVKSNAEKLKEAETLRQTESVKISRKFYDWISSLQEQINELAYMKLSDIQAQEELDGRLSVMESEIDAVMSEIDPDGTATDDEADEAIEDAFSTETAIEVEPEFEEMIDEIFGVNP